MAKFIEVLKILIMLTPILIQAIKMVEENFPAGSGKEKLEQVRQILAEAYEMAQELSIPFSEIWPHIERLVNSIVAAYNRLGIFKKTAAE